jgi:hypothetical protein
VGGGSDIASVYLDGVVVADGKPLIIWRSLVEVTVSTNLIFGIKFYLIIGGSGSQKQRRVGLGQWAVL